MVGKNKRSRQEFPCPHQTKCMKLEDLSFYINDNVDYLQTKTQQFIMMLFLVATETLRTQNNHRITSTRTTGLCLQSTYSTAKIKNQHHGQFNSGDLIPLMKLTSSSAGVLCY